MTTLRRLAWVVTMASLAAVTGCSSGNTKARTRATNSAPVSTAATSSVPPRAAGASDRVVVRGNALG